MNVDGVAHRTIWRDDASTVLVIDQRLLPFRFEVLAIETCTAMAAAIADMTVRGAGLIGASAGYGMYLAAVEAAAAEPDDAADRRVHLRRSADLLLASRPTAVNLSWAVDRQLSLMSDIDDPDELVAKASAEADAIANEDAEHCRRIGQHGLSLLENIHRQKVQQAASGVGDGVDGEVGPVNVLTHCNAGWLAFVDHGTATAPIYAAHDAGIPVHVWVDETRPRNQGARLTAWELAQHGVPHTIIVDNAGGHLMQHGMVDVVITGTDRTSANGDVANKIGTYLKALAARDNDVPFYVALPSSSIDWSLTGGVAGTPIEERDAREVTHLGGIGPDGDVVEVRVVPEGSRAANHAFDVTPSRLVTGLITERGVCAASVDGIASLFPEAGAERMGDQG